MTPPSDVELARLLVELFDAEELQRFLRDEYREISDSLPINMGLIPLASLAAEALARRNLVDELLFTRLVARRPRCVGKILGAGHARDQVSAAPSSARTYRWAGLSAGLCGAAGIVALVWTRVSGQPGSCEAAGDCTEVERPGEPPPPRDKLESEAPAVAPVVLRCPDGMMLIDDIGGTKPMCLDRSEVTRGAFCSLASGSAPSDLNDVQAAYRCVPEAGVRDWWSHPITHVRPDEATAHCAARGLQLPERQAFARVLGAELGGRQASEVLATINLCGVECHRGQRPETGRLSHRDRHPAVAPVGSYRLAFASPHGLDDIFGNVGEMVRDGALVFACGGGFQHSRLAVLDPGACIAPGNPPLASTASDPATGFRCAGEPNAVASRELSGRAGS